MLVSELEPPVLSRQPLDFRPEVALSLLGGSLNPYSVEIRSADGSSGIVLVEIYDVTDP